MVVDNAHMTADKMLCSQHKDQKEPLTLPEVEVLGPVQRWFHNDRKRKKESKRRLRQITLYKPEEN